MVVKEDVRALVEEFLKDSDCFLVDVKLSTNKLMISIDKPEGVKLDECSALTRFLLNHYEESTFLEKHEVEVGSPGMDSPLLVPQQYQRRIGKELRVIKMGGMEIKGILQSVDEAGILLLETQSKKENKKKIITEVEHQIPFADIKEATLIINYKFK